MLHLADVFCFINMSIIYKFANQYLYQLIIIDIIIFKKILFFKIITWCRKIISNNLQKNITRF